MAGIGFALRKLITKDDLYGLVQAYLYSAVIASGAWMLIASTLVLLSAFTPGDDTGTLMEFQTILLYNLLFSFIIAAPIYMVSSRYVSDCLFKKDPSLIPGIMLKGQFHLIIPALIFSSCFYFFYVSMSPLLTLLTVINFVLFADVWMTAIYLSAIRNFRAILQCWFVGFLVTVILGLALGGPFKVTGLIAAVDMGLVVILFSLKAYILAEFPYRFLQPGKFVFYYRNYQYLFWSGLLLFSSMWIDKLIMWTTPHAIRFSNNLVSYPTYDNAMLRAYLSIIPAMALFIFSLETNFYDAYIKYVRNIEDDSPFSELEENRQKLLVKIAENSRNIIVLQGSLSLLVIAVAPGLFSLFKLDFLQLSIFRFGVLGAFLNVLNLFIVIFFSYFDSQENMFKIALTMFLSNALFTCITLFLGFGYFGVGYCLSMAISFLVASLLFLRFLQNLHYHVFVTNAVKGRKLRMRPKS